MPICFADTSALAKVCTNEIGTDWLRGLLDPTTGTETYIVRITAVELISAITRREKGGSASTTEAADARAAIRTDVTGHLQILEVTELLVGRAMALAETHALRGYDAVQLAAALQLKETLLAGGLPPLTLISADAELNAAAIAEGLVVEDPNQHP